MKVDLVLLFCKTSLVDEWIHREFIPEIRVCLAQMAGRQVGLLSSYSCDSGYIE